MSFRLGFHSVCFLDPPGGERLPGRAEGDQFAVHQQDGVKDVRRPILIYLFDPDIATTLGIPSRLISYGIFTLIILVLVSSLQAVGAFLTLGLLVGPAATVYMLTNKPAHLFWGGGIIGGLGSLLAFYLSFPLGWHLGATIILVLGIIFCAAYLYSSRCGLLKQCRKNSSSLQ